MYRSCKEIFKMIATGKEYRNTVCNLYVRFVAKVSDTVESPMTASYRAKKKSWAKEENEIVRLINRE